MKKVYLLLVLCIILTLIAQVKAQDREFSFSEKYKVNQPANFKVKTSDGNIQIGRTSGSEVEVYYRVTKNGKLMNISRSELEETVSIIVMKGPNLLDITVKHEDQFMGWRNRMNVSFDVLVPEKTSCTLISSDGNISMDGITGNQYMKSSDGNIRVSNVAGSIEVKTSDGNLTIHNIGGNAQLKTSDGNMTITQIKGSVSGRTSDGNVTVEDVRGSLSIGTSDGNITSTNIGQWADLSSSDGHIKLFKASGDIKLKTSDGSIEFQNISGSLTATTSDGHVRGNIDQLNGPLYLKTTDGNVDVSVPEGLGLDLVLRGNKVHTRLSQFDGVSKEKSVNGTINGGGIPVEISAGDGSVSLTYR